MCEVLRTTRSPRHLTLAPPPPTADSPAASWGVKGADIITGEAYWTYHIFFSVRCPLRRHGVDAREASHETGCAPGCMEGILKGGPTPHHYSTRLVSVFWQYSPPRGIHVEEYSRLFFVGERNSLPSRLPQRGLARYAGRGGTAPLYGKGFLFTTSKMYRKLGSRRVNTPARPCFGSPF